MTLGRQNRISEWKRPKGREAASEIVDDQSFHLTVILSAKASLLPFWAVVGVYFVTLLECIYNQVRTRTGRIDGIEISSCITFLRHNCHEYLTWPTLI